MVTYVTPLDGAPERPWAFQSVRIASAMLQQHFGQSETPLTCEVSRICSVTHHSIRRKSITVSSGGLQVVESGASATGATVSSGGQDYIVSGVRGGPRAGSAVWGRPGAGALALIRRS
jgi:autotransporter passenger strand-loop-strand repeat protein